MHVGKKTLSALMALTLTASLAACSASTPADTTHAATPSENLVQTSSTPSVDEEGAKRTEYPLTITTYNYNKEPVEYTFEKAPERVYAYAQDNIEILLSLGLITGVLMFDNAGTALMLAIFALQDSFGTACNVTGDGALTLMLTGYAEKHGIADTGDLESPIL